MPQNLLDKQWKGFGPDPRDTTSLLYVQPDDVVIPIREIRDADGNRQAELGEPVKARDLSNDSDR